MRANPSADIYKRWWFWLIIVVVIIAIANAGGSDEPKQLTGELAAGGKVTGTISFEQPKDDPQLQLQYEPSFWSDKTIKVNLQ